METTEQKKTFRGLKAAVATVLAAVGMFAFAVTGVQAAETDVEQDKKVIVIDAGHGGRDPGAVDPDDGYTEADIVQDMAERMAGLFEDNDDVEVVLAHEPGVYMDITERGAVANRNDADLFISLHLNAAENRNASGFQIFPDLPGRTHHEESMAAAEAIVGHVREIGRPVMGTNGVYYAIYRGSNKDFYDAATVTGRLSGSSFGVLESSDTPSLLIEQWFITNKGDMQMFNNNEGMDLMARQLYRGICEYFEVEAQH